MKQEFERLKEMLKTTTPCTEKYEQILREMEMVATISDLSSYAFEPLTCAQEPAKVTTKTIVDSPETYSADTTGYSKEEVREMLTDASKNGVKIQPIMKQFVPEGLPVKFSSVPAESYEALVKAVQDAQ